MNLTNDEAQYFINIAKRLEYYILKIPMEGSKEKYPAHSTDGKYKFDARMYLAKKKRSNKNKASYTLFYSNKICLTMV